jgi:hypothetical protein
MGLTLNFGVVRITQEQKTCTVVETYSFAARRACSLVYDAVRNLLRLYHFRVRRPFRQPTSFDFLLTPNSRYPAPDYSLQQAVAVTRVT